MLVLFAALVVGGAGGWYFIAQASNKQAFELVLKSTDKAVATRIWSGQGIADEGAPIAPGTTLDTRNSQKTIFRFGPTASLRAAPKTEFRFVDSEMTKSGAERRAYARLELVRGRLWLIGSTDTHFLIQAGVARVRTLGKVTEVSLAENGACNVIVWQGEAELTPVKHPDRSVVVGEGQEASFGADGTLVNPHPLTLTRDDSWLAWNLRETMGKEINERPVTDKRPHQ